MPSRILRCMCDHLQNQRKNELKTCLACQTQVEDGMYIASLPFYPIDKRTYDIEEISAEQSRDGSVSGNLQLRWM